ncbi:hypothetical protein DB32_001643 [Sandaracinus amylolyticus]|uniref:Uncharacterized protein n=1 Tax=Sandaracinus amylolyticus TaxID=927083 RepID=A0A0F6SE33_9BACT|nr:hypothetical protein DB32_001643 [Sandaracinus amylolyticus]
MVPLGVGCVVAGCNGDVSSGGVDAGVISDAATPTDAGSREDAGSMVDASRPDAGGGGVGCEGRDYLFCEDFESAAPGSLPEGWTVGGGWQLGDSVPEVTSESVHTGARALRSSIAISGQRRAERSIESLGDARGVHWGRVFYRVQTPAFVPSGGVVHNTLLALLGADEARVVDTVIRNDGAHQFLYNVPDDSCCAGSSYDHRTYDGDWHCAEWRVDRTTQSYRFFIDGDEVDDIAFDHGAGDTRARMDAFSRIALGWRNYQTPDTPYTSYFDDLAIDDERIGCE